MPIYDVQYPPKSEEEIGYDSEVIKIWAV